MPRIGLAGRLSPRRAARSERDKFLFVVKVATLVVVTGIVAGVLLVSGGGDDVAIKDPAVPTITDADGGEPAPPPPPPPTATIVVPVVGSGTAVIANRPEPEHTSRPARPKPRPAPDPGFARPGRPCSAEGSLAFTKRFEPLVCRDGRWDRIV